jgi:hypothetical protein
VSDFYITIVGNDTLIKAMALAGAKAPALLTAALVEEANLAFRRSQAMVPFRFGILKGSGRVAPPITILDETFVEISYGGAASAYAYIMHKGIMNDKPITYHTPGTHDHYLSDAVEETIPGMEGRIMARIEGMLHV